MTQTKKGFTLIELLVVIAIIGLLASVILASLKQARVKAADASIKQNLSGIRPQAALYYESHSQSFGSDIIASTCTDDPGNFFNLDTTIANAIEQSRVVGGGGTVGSSGMDTICSLSGTEWMVMIPLRGQTDHVWCVDSLGNSNAIPEDNSLENALNSGNLYSCVIP